MLRLMTSCVFSSALIPPKLFLLAEVVSLGREVLALVLRGLRPWNEMLEGEIWCFRTAIAQGANKEDEAAIAFSFHRFCFCVLALVDAFLDGWMMGIFGVFARNRRGYSGDKKIHRYICR